MLIVVLGSHLAAGFIGVGMSVLVFACLKVAGRMNDRATEVGALASAARYCGSFLLAAACAACIAMPWLFLLVKLRAPFTVVASLVGGAVASAFCFVKFRIFGKVQVADAGHTMATGPVRRR